MSKIIIFFIFLYLLFKVTSVLKFKKKDKNNNIIDADFEEID